MSWVLLGQDQVELTGYERGKRDLRLQLGHLDAAVRMLLVPGLKSALVAALATGAVATINSTVWLLAGSLSWWRLLLASLGSVALVVGRLVIDDGLWDRPEDDSAGRQGVRFSGTLVV